MILRTGKKGWAMAIFGLMTPLLIGFASQHTFPAFLKTALEENVNQARIIMIVHNTTSFAMIASVLNDLKLLNTELGRLALSSALVGDILSSILITISSGLINEHNLIKVGLRLVSLCVLVMVIMFVYRPAMFKVIDNTPEGKDVDDIYVHFIIGILFSLVWFSLPLERGSMALPFLFGLATPEGPPLGSTLIKRTHLLGTKLLLPIFLTTCAMKVEADFLKLSSSAFLIATFIVLLGHGIKMVACLVSSLLFNMPLKDGLALAFLFNFKGAVEVVMYSTALDRSDLYPITYAVLMTVMMISSTISQLLVKFLYDPSRKYAGYQKRNIFSLKPNSDLRIQVCIHKQHHITPITSVLDLCYPTAEEPIIVDVMHLIELVGRTSPIFITHKKKKVVAEDSQNSYSYNVILAFKLLEDEKQGAVVVNPYTAISPPNLMYEDVCNLALDKVSSIIILPFHRKWTACGRVEYDDKDMRTLNCMVLERAPCSVGILVTRAIHQTGTSLQLALIFLGGNDDREALCLANRAARDPSVNLMVYHIVRKDNDEKQDLGAVLDNAMLKDVKKAHSDMGNISYREIEVEGGSQTVSILRQVVDEHDFIIVGRRHGINSPQTTGLQQWSEFSELGLIGDYLASADLNSKSSILVVQQQQLSL
ncbi:Sodium/solute symporter superfamily [Sesbania bispinosa]|nr:Sodium/solute symporter superfamily [Sesbania bispinosa]